MTANAHSAVEVEVGPKGSRRPPNGGAGASRHSRTARFYFVPKMRSPASPIPGTI